MLRARKWMLLIRATSLLAVCACLPAQRFSFQEKVRIDMQVTDNKSMKRALSMNRLASEGNANTYVAIDSKIGALSSVPLGFASKGAASTKMLEVRSIFDLKTRELSQVRMDNQTFWTYIYDLDEPVSKAGLDFLRRQSIEWKGIETPDKGPESATLVFQGKVLTGSGQPVDVIASFWLGEEVDGWNAYSQLVRDSIAQGIIPHGNTQLASGIASAGIASVRGIFIKMHDLPSPPRKALLQIFESLHKGSYWKPTESGDVRLSFEYSDFSSSPDPKLVQIPTGFQKVNPPR
jgi:hypothetical protein